MCYIVLPSLYSYTILKANYFGSSFADRLPGVREETNVMLPLMF